MPQRNDTSTKDVTVVEIPDWQPYFIAKDDGGNPIVVQKARLEEGSFQVGTRIRLFLRHGYLIERVEILE